MTVDHSTQSGRAPLIERKDDLYETPAVATEALLRVEKLPQNIWEPACGRSAIVNVLRAAGHGVLATDLVDYGEPGPATFYRRDFLMEREPPPNCGCIVTNPPYKLAGEFVTHALDLCPRVIMLLRLAFLESERRRSILDSGHLARVHVFRNRLPMMHRDGWGGAKASSSIPFAWFVWDREHSGPTELRRISWSNDYCAQADFAGSLQDGYDAIRKRQAAGGTGWVPK